MTLRVLHLTSTWLPQTQTWIHTQVACVPQERIQCHVACKRVENLEQFPVSNLYRVRELAPVRKIMRAASRMLKLRAPPSVFVQAARRVRPQVVHSHFGNAAWRHIDAAKDVNAAHIASFYGYDASRLPRRAVWRERLQELFAAADAILCEGPHMARTLAELGCPQAKLRVHHLGVSLERLAYRPRQWRAGEPLKVLIAATFTEKKGIPYAIRALGRVRREIDLQVTLIGDARKKPEHKEQKGEILRAIDESGLAGLVRRVGYQTHAEMIRQAYDHHVFLAPSVTAASGDTEGGAPVSIAEMAATGMLVISSHHCDIPELVVDGVTGFLAQERDVDGIVACLRRAAGSPDAWPAMLEGGRRRIDAEFNARTQGMRLAEIYEQIAGAS